jgi:hypothetical protein
LEVPVLNQEPAYAAEINRWEIVFQIDIEDPPTVSMLVSVRDNGTAPLEAMSRTIDATLCDINFIHTVLQKIREIPLKAL